MRRPEVDRPDAVLQDHDARDPESEQDHREEHLPGRRGEHGGEQGRPEQRERHRGDMARFETIQCETDGERDQSARNCF